MHFLRAIVLTLMVIKINGSTDFGAKIQQMKMECLETLNIDIDTMMEDVKQGIVTKDQVNLFQCVLEKFEIIKDGKINWEQLENIRNMYKNACETDAKACEFLKRMENLIRCSKELTMDAPLTYEMVEALTKCITEGKI